MTGIRNCNRKFLHIGVNVAKPQTHTDNTTCDTNLFRNYMRTKWLLLLHSFTDCVVAPESLVFGPISQTLTGTAK